MKFKDNFSDLAKANEYITELNEAYKKMIQSIEAEKKKADTLQVALDKANSDLTGFGSKIENLVAEKTKELEVKLVAAGEEIEVLRQDKDKADIAAEEALKAVEDLSAKLDLQEQHGGDGILVTVGKQSYKLIGKRFVTKNGDFTAEEISKNQEELKRMVEKNQVR